MELDHLFERNRAWAAQISKRDPDFFPRLARQQKPEYLWIGCADSRVPANEILGLDPGEVFVHRNIANVVVHTDLNCLSVIQFAVDVLKVKHIMVVGHYGCGGVSAAMRCERVGLVDNWLRHIQDVKEKHEACLCRVTDESLRALKLCEYNTIEQVDNVCKTSIVRDAWARGQYLRIHGFVYGVRDGLLHDLQCSAGSVEEAAETYRSSVAAMNARPGPICDLMR